MIICLYLNLNTDLADVWKRPQGGHVNSLASGGMVDIYFV